MIPILVKALPAMLGVAAMFILFGWLRPGEECGGHCRMCSSGCATKQAHQHD